MVEEIEGQSSNGNWEIIPRLKVPQGTPVLPAVWALKRKRKISSRDVYKWKARLNLDGSKQVHGVHFWDTYALWPIIRLILIMSVVLHWLSIQIDYVQAYAQADVETDNVCMNVPKGFDLTDGANAKDWDLHIRTNIYGGKAANRVWSKWGF